MGREVTGLSANVYGGDIGTGRDGELLQAWDLFVGQKIDVLGKPTTLMQANHGTLMWLEYHARRLLKKALELENEIMQFKPIPDIVHRMLNTRVSLSPSSSSSALPSPSRPARIAPMCSSSARVGRRICVVCRRQCVKQTVHMHRTELRIGPRCACARPRLTLILMGYVVCGDRIYQAEA